MVNGHVQNKKDELIDPHFRDGHKGFKDMSIQVIDWVKGEKELRDKYGLWIYQGETQLKPDGVIHIRTE